MQMSILEYRSQAISVSNCCLQEQLTAMKIVCNKERTGILAFT